MKIFIPKFIPNFVEFGQLIQKKKFGDTGQTVSHRHTYNQQSFLFYLGQEKLDKPKKGKGLPQWAEVAQEVPGGLTPWIFLTFGTTRVVRRQPYTSAAFTPGKIPGTHF